MHVFEPKKPQRPGRSFRKDLPGRMPAAGGSPAARTGAFSPPENFFEFPLDNCRSSAILELLSGVLIVVSLFRNLIPYFGIAGISKRYKEDNFMTAAYLTPAITLFSEDGTLDLVSQERLFNNLIDQGVDGILVEGSSSEFFAMPMNQRREMAKFAIEKVNHRVKLIIGTSHMVADEIVSFSNYCLDAGADAVMILPPYYFHFDASALLQYYDRLAQQIHGDIYIYNFPDNTGYTIPAETVLALAKIHPNIVGMKDTVSGMDHTRELIKVVKSHIPQFEIYSGFDDNFAHNVLAGGDGCIGALSNVVPEICAAWVKAFRENDLAGIAQGQQIIDRLMDLYTVRSPFLPVIKEACRLRGIAATSVGTFPMPNATVEDDAKILELLNREGVQ